MFTKLLLLVLTLNLTSAYVPTVEGGPQNELPDSLEGVGIDEKLNTNLPSNLTFLNESGESVKISSFYSENKPVILSLVYFSCPSLCNLHLKGVFDVFNDLGLKAGKDFEFIAVSIDAKEGPDLAAAKKETYVSELLGESYTSEFTDGNPNDGIHFLSGTQENITALSKAVGFKYKWNEEAQDWAHASAAIISTPTGLISRYLHGVYFEPKIFRLSIVEASKGMVGSIVDHFALFCFRYDPKTNKYSFYIMNVLKGVAFLVLLLLLAWLVPFWWRSKNTSSQN